MNQDELLSELDIAYSAIHKISNAIASPSGIVGGDFTYLEGKLKAFENVAKHVTGQCKYKKAEQRKLFKKPVFEKLGYV